MTVEELQNSVSELSAEELAAFSTWFGEFMADQWDRQIEADIRARRLDAVARLADEGFESGRSRPLT